MSTFSYARIHADERGESQFSDEELSLEPITPGPGIPPTPASSPMPVTGMRVFCHPAGGDADWHPAPGRIRCYKYNIGLDAMRFFAKTDNRGAYDGAVQILEGLGK